MWTIQASSLSWMLGAELPDGDVHLGTLPEGKVSVRRVAQEDQARWRESRHKLMRGYGALGDTEELRAYPFLPIPEWVLDCCTAATEVRAEPITMPGDVEFDAGDLHAVLWMTGLAGIDFRSTQAADVMRLVIEPNIQVVCEELLVSVDSGSYAASHHAWTAPGFRQRFRRLRWSLAASSADSVVTAWRSAALGPNAQLIRFPLRRLGIAAQRSFDEDRLFDLWVGLDGLFKRDGESRGIGIRTARRAGLLLNADAIERRRLNRTIPRSYVVRGDLVHGRSDYADEELNEAIEVANDVLRRSLVAVIDKADPIDPSADAPPLTA